jgi:CRISPR-associated protein Cmr3
MLSVGDEKIDPSRKGNYAIALQPILIHSDKTTADINEVAGLECVEEVYGVFDGERFRVRVIDVGLGFSEVCKFRRPILKALPQGTVVKLKDNDECRGVIAVGLLSTLGYGSIYRVNYRG